MAKLNALEALYNKRKSPLEFNFDMLWAPPLLSLLTPQDIYELNRIAKSVKLAGKIDEKYKLIDQIMTNRGFVKLHAGTNRVVYRFIEDQRFVAKIAVDRVGLGDNPAEFKNQFLLKPFVTKVFEVSPCGTVAIVERVDAVMSREEFLSIADDVFSLLTKFFLGKYVLDDIGSWFFMNWGTRKGYGPVLLDFPYVYELDGNKLYCNAKPIPGRRDIICGGQIDYDDGFNNLICTKCGRPYHARDLKKEGKEKLIIVGGKKTMKVQVKIGNTVIKDSSKTQVAKVIEPVDEEKNVYAQYRVQGRANIIKETKKENNPNVSILNKQIDPKKESEKVLTETVEDIKEEPVEITHTVTTEEKDMNTELEEVLENQNDYDEYDDYDEYEEYNDYLNNRQRSNKISPKMKSSKKGNNDFKGF